MVRRRVSILLMAFLFIVTSIVSYAGESTQTELVTLGEDSESADQEDTSGGGDSAGGDYSEDSSGDESPVGDTGTSEGGDSSATESAGGDASSNSGTSTEGTGNTESNTTGNTTSGTSSGQTSSSKNKSTNRATGTTETTENAEADLATSGEDGAVQTGDEGTASQDNLSTDGDTTSENVDEGPYQLIYDVNIADSTAGTDQEEGSEEDELTESATGDHTRYIIDQVFETGSTEQVISIEEAFPTLEDTADNGMGYTDQYRKFVYWNTEPDGSGATLDPGEEEEVVFTDHDIILYAVWTKIDLTMSVDRDGDGAYDDDESEVSVGDNVTYRISYANGYDYAVSLAVTETLDKGLTFVSAESGEYAEETRTLTWYLDYVEPGAEGNLQFTAAVNENANQNSEVASEASVRVDSFPAVETNRVKNWVPIELTVSNVWDDNGDQEGIRPESLRVQLLSDGTASGDPVELNEGNSWTYTWKDLPRYSDGKEIIYTVEGDPVEGYDQTYGETIDKGDGTYGIQVTNEFVSATVKVGGSVTWADVSEEEDYSRKRPEEITVHLYADGNKVKNLTLTEADDWEWDVSGLDKYNGDGIPITYTITVDTVKDYVTEIDGYEIINSYSPYKVNLNIQLVWDDADDEEGIRPESVAVDLLENGEKTGDTLTLDESNGWSASFTDLDTYTNGEDIDYTVEVSPIDGYKTFLSEERDTNCILLRSARTDGSEDETEDDSTADAAETGDDTPVGLMTGLMLAAGAVLIAEVRYRKRYCH